MMNKKKMELSNKSSQLFKYGLLLLNVVSSQVYAATDLKPSWVRKPVLDLPNCSFLSPKDPLSLADYRDEVFTPKQAMELRQQYDDLTRTYQMRKNYSLLEFQEEENHRNQLTGFGKTIQDRVLDHEAKKSEERFKALARKDGNLKKPAAVVGALVTVYTGRPVTTRLSENTRLVGRTTVRPDATGKVQWQSGQLQLLSPLVNTTFDVAATLPASVDPNTAEAAKAEDRYKLSVTRALPLVNVSSGLTYGSTTRTLSASLSRQLTDHLSCVIDTRRPLSPEWVKAKPGEETVRLIYGISF